MTGYFIGPGAVAYGRLGPASIVVAGADPRTFRSLRPDRGSCFIAYGRDQNAVYFAGVKIEGADPGSFQVLAEIYAADRLSWYGEGTRIASRAGGELQLLDGEYARHAEGVFHGARRLEAEGFEMLGRQGYARSKSRAYFKGEEIPGIDAASFRLVRGYRGALSDSVARDERHVLLEGRVLSYIDAPSFEFVAQGRFARDKNNVYINFKPVEGADPSRFAVIDERYWRDGRSVYYRSTRIEGADPESFRLRSYRYAADKLRVYLEGRPLPDRDAASFQDLGYFYTKDKHGVYYEDRLVAGADRATFQAISHSQAWDKLWGYNRGTRVCVLRQETHPGARVCQGNPPR